MGGCDAGAGSSYVAGRSRANVWLRRFSRGVRAAASLAVAGFVVACASWLSVNPGVSIGSQSLQGWGVSSSSSSVRSGSSLVLVSHLDPPCLTSQGVQVFPVSGISPWVLPSWVESEDGAVCVMLGASSLVDTTPGEPAPEPSPSPGQTALLSEMQGFRNLYLYSGGLMICLLAAILFRSRR